jgi:hypothetical protein
VAEWVGVANPVRGKPLSRFSKNGKSTICGNSAILTTIYSGNFIENFSKKRSDCTTNIWNREEQ